MTNGKDCVLGSGPAAVACAHQLIKAGRQVVMIDPARRMTADRETLIEDFRRNPDPKSFAARMRALRRDLPADFQPKRLPFSSPHVYQDIDRVLPAESHDAQITRSLATGGLSAMWGATVMPFSSRSFRNWPITAEEMAPYYRNVAEIMDVPRVHDDLAAMYPNYGNAAPTALSEQGAQLMASLLNSRNRLARDGITFGRNRSAIGATYAVNGQGCVYCGLCMYGCPYQAVFSAEHVVERLKVQNGFDYQPNRIAEAFEENETGVRVRLRHLDNGHAETLECERLFVACGASTSLRLVADTLKWFDTTLYLMDTQLVTIPAFLRYRCSIGAIPQAIALGQVFLEIDDAEICDELVHLQVYGFNPFIADVLRARWGRLFIGDRFLQPLFDRLMTILVYLPGQISGRVALRVSPPSQNGIGLPAAKFTGEANPRTKPAVRRIGRILNAHRRDFGWLPVLPLAEIPDLGTSNHLAGGLPMRNVPGPYESDRLGRPYGLGRVHVVDGACFSDLPAEHLTYTIMANATRIAAQSTEEDIS